jgi:hypothetical protein
MEGFRWLPVLPLLSITRIESVLGAPVSPPGTQPSFPEPLEKYHDEQTPRLVAKLIQRVQIEPINLVGTLLKTPAVISLRLKFG